MAPAVIHCVMCNQDKTRGRWSDRYWSQDTCQECCEMMEARIRKYKTQQLIKDGKLGF